VAGGVPAHGQHDAGLGGCGAPGLDHDLLVQPAASGSLDGQRGVEAALLAVLGLQRSARMQPTSSRMMSRA
jgi:hypothetical protein